MPYSGSSIALWIDCTATILLSATVDPIPSLTGWLTPLYAADGIGSKVFWAGCRFLAVCAFACRYAVAEVAVTEWNYLNRPK